MTEKVVGLPSTASCRTAGTVAYIMAALIMSAAMAISQTVPRAISTGVRSVDDGSSSALSEMIRCRWSLTAEYAIRAAAPTTTSAPPYTATPMPNSCFQ